MRLQQAAKASSINDDLTATPELLIEFYNNAIYTENRLKDQVLYHKIQPLSAKDVIS